jgi:hypothetical protein
MCHILWRHVNRFLVRDLGDEHLHQAQFIGARQGMDSWQ